MDTAHLRVNLAVLEDVAKADRVVAGDPAWDIEAAFDFLDWGSRDAIEAWPGPWPELGADDRPESGSRPSWPGRSRSWADGRPSVG